MSEIFHRIVQQRQVEQAVLVHLQVRDDEDAEDLDEFRELVHSAGAQEACLIIARPGSFRARTLIGSGKVEEIAAAVAASEAKVVIVNHALSPAQERNLENDLKCRVVDRVGLILDIFAQRAQSFEGKLQVELAQLKHMATRLVGGWKHLERQKGGIGLRGPGETQLETDRRLLQERIRMLQKRLEKVRGHRDLSRRARSRNEVPTVVLVGYTNAGKSSLFNRLTQADVYAEDRLFATLDTTLRRLHLPGVGPCVLADTVGFIRHIPHDLVAAFRSTLEEAAQASLLIHLVDAADPRRDEKIADVQSVLHEIGADQVPQLLVYNKIDLLQPSIPARVDVGLEPTEVNVWLSAHTGAGMDLLIRAIAERLEGVQVQVEVILGPHQGRERAKLFATGQVLSETSTEDGSSCLILSLSPAQWQEISDNSAIEHKRRLAPKAVNA